MSEGLFVLLRAMRARSPGFARLGAALRFPGLSEGGRSFGLWLGVLAFAWLVAYLFEPWEPALILVPPMLTLAILGPGAQAFGARSPRLRRPARLLRSVEMPLAALVFAFIGAIVFGQMWRRGMLIDTGDNQYMMARAKVFCEGLRHGHWMHWTHLWQAGDTLTDLYPIEANLLTAGVHALAPRGTSFATSYTAFVLLSWWLRGVGVYYLARRFTSPLLSFALGCAALFDVGSDVMGGTWFAAIYFGMIHNTLALTFGLFATALQVDLTRRVTSGRMVACTLFVALAACGHALGVLVMVVEAFALGVATWVGRGSRREAAWAFLATSLGLALAAVWLVPFTRALAAGNFRVSMTGSTFRELGTALLNGSTPTSSFAAFIGLALVAAGAASISGEVGVAAAGIASLLLVSLVLTPLLVSARVFHYLPAFVDGQPPRFLSAFKTVCLPCVAWLLGTLERKVPASTGSLRVSRVLGRALLLGILVYGPGMALLSGMESLGASLREQIKTIGPSAERSHTGADYRHVFGWLKQQRREDKGPLLWRAAVIWRNTFRHGTWAEGLETGVPIVDPSQVPSNFFEVRPREVNARGFNDWNVRFVLTDFEGPPFPETVERFKSGSFHIWELEHFDDRYAITPPGVRVTNVALEGESIRFRVEGAPETGADIQLRTAAFPRWRARQDGQWLAVSSRLPRPDAKLHQEQLLVHATNGNVVMTCDGTMPGYYTGLFATLAAALCVSATASARRRERIAARLVAARDAALRLANRTAFGHVRWFEVVLATSALAVLVIGGFARLKGARTLNGSTLVGLGAFDVQWQVYGHPKRCLPVPWRDAFVCGNGEVVVEGWLGTKGVGDDSGEGPVLWPGVRVSSHQANTVVLSFGRVHLDPPDGLWIQNSTWNAHHAKVTWGDTLLAKTDFSGEEMHQFALPPGQQGGARPLTIELEAPLDGSSCVIRGGSGKAPPLQ